MFVATSPTELIVTDGEPNWVPVEGTRLLYIQNTTGNVFKALSDQQTYVLISGRWYRGSSESGPWEYVSGKALPADFASIPDDSPKENVKASVPGTPQAAEALIADEIPQTAKVDLRETRMTVPEYDGEPELASIPGTPLQYVVNASLPVILADDGKWYSVENGVWFVADSPRGPWAVARSVPPSIYSIPPDSPLHYVTYVRIYDASADSVQVGYTPGYTGSCIDDDGLIVYGTGYVYTPWIGNVWYGPPVTWGLGFGLAWTPWWGWGFDAGFGWGWGPGWVWGCHSAPLVGTDRVGLAPRRMAMARRRGPCPASDAVAPGRLECGKRKHLPAMGRDRDRLTAARSLRPSRDAPSGRPLWPLLQLPHRRPGGGTAGGRPQCLSDSVRLCRKRRLRGRRRARLPPGRAGELAAGRSSRRPSSGPPTGSAARARTRRANDGRPAIARRPAAQPAAAQRSATRSSSGRASAHCATTSSRLSAGTELSTLRTHGDAEPDSQEYRRVR